MDFTVKILPPLAFRTLQCSQRGDKKNAMFFSPVPTRLLSSPFPLDRKMLFPRCAPTTLSPGLFFIPAPFAHNFAKEEKSINHKARKSSTRTYSFLPPFPLCFPWKGLLRYVRKTFAVNQPLSAAYLLEGPLPGGLVP